MSAPDKNLAKRVVDKMMHDDAFSKWLGVEVLDVQDGAATVRMKVRAEMLNGFKVCHGGIPFSLADSALAFAANTNGNITMSVENNIGYPKAVLEGDVLTAQAKQLSSSRRIAHYTVDVKRADGELVAIFRGTVYRTEKEHFPQ